MGKARKVHKLELGNKTTWLGLGLTVKKSVRVKIGIGYCG